MNASLLALLVTLMAGFLPAQETRPAVPPELEQRFVVLHQEFSAAVGRFQKAAEEARAKSAPAPERPHKQFAARYAELGRLGHPRAARWCLDFIADTPEAERRALYLDCEAQLVPQVLWAESTRGQGNPPPIDYGVSDLLRSLGGAGKLLGKEKAIALCNELFDKLALADSKALALHTQTTILLAGLPAEADMPPEVLALYSRLAGEFGETDSGKRAAGLLFRREHLQLGMLAPDFTTQDVAGETFQLSQSRGKVVVLDFWGLWCGHCLETLPHLKELDARMKGRAFALIGIDTDPDKDAYRAKAKELGVSWRNSWQGSTAGVLPRAWGITSFPTIFVLDGKGVIRYTGVRGAALDQAVDTLLAELEEKH